MNTGYRNQQYQHQTPSTDPGWMLIYVVFALAIGLIALPWIILGVLVERVLSQWLHEKQSFLLWVILFFVSAFFLYTHYQHGLQPLIIHELTAYIHVAKRYQTDFTHWPLHSLWVDTFPVWMQTWQGVGIVGFWAELFIHPHKKDTTQMLRQNEHNRQRRASRSQQRARRHSIRPGYVPDAVGSMMVIGIPIHDELEGE